MMKFLLIALCGLLIAKSYGDSSAASSSAASSSTNNGNGGSSGAAAAAAASSSNRSNRRPGPPPPSALGPQGPPPPSGPGPIFQCGYNQDYSDCGYDCDTCDNIRAPHACPAVCTKGCFCRPGFVRNQQGNCVAPSQCPPAPNQCGFNEEFNECGTVCPDTCDNLGTAHGCGGQCVRGCFCKQGFVRNQQGQCVAPSQCPQAQCGVNEEFSDCGTNCPDTCDNLGTPHACGGQCVRGCFCKQGFVRNQQGQCVAPSQCPQAQCGFNEEYSDCGTNCPDTCDNRGTAHACGGQCVKGCFCKQGFVRNRQGYCVDPSQCPPPVQCGYNEVYKDCGFDCDTCDNMGTPHACPAVCTKGCFCRPGFVRSRQGYCVFPFQCSQGGGPPQGPPRRVAQQGPPGNGGYSNTQTQTQSQSQSGSGIGGSSASQYQSQSQSGSGMGGSSSQYQEQSQSNSGNYNNGGGGNNNNPPPPPTGNNNNPSGGNNNPTPPPGGNNGPTTTPGGNNNSTPQPGGNNGPTTTPGNNPTTPSPTSASAGTTPSPDQCGTGDVVSKLLCGLQEVVDALLDVLEKNT